MMNVYIPKLRKNLLEAIEAGDQTSIQRNEGALRNLTKSSQMTNSEPARKALEEAGITPS